MRFSLSQCVQQYTNLVDAVLESGPVIQANLDDTKIIVEAARRIRERTIAQFGLSAETISDEELKTKLLEDSQVQAANEKLTKALGGNQGPFADMLMQLIQIAMTNPALLQLILSLFKKPA